MKRKDGFYFQISRQPFQSNGNPPEIHQLSYQSAYLWLWLTELEHRYTGKISKKDGKVKNHFFRSDEDLSKDSGMPKRTLTRCKKELVSKGFIETWQAHWVDSETQKLSVKHITAFRMLK